YLCIAAGAGCLAGHFGQSSSSTPSNTSAGRSARFITFRSYRQKLSRGAQKTAPPKGAVIKSKGTKVAYCISHLLLYGGVSCVAQAVGMSTVILSCAFSFENTPHVNAIARAAQKSLIDASGASWSGDFVGEKYICADSQLEGITTMPGTESSSAINCIAR